MPDRRYKVRVFVKAESSKDPGREDPARAFNLDARHADRASVAARAHLEARGAEVLSISHAPGDTMVVTIGREPRKTPPTTLVANVARPRPAPRRLPPPAKKGATA